MANSFHIHETFDFIQEEQETLTIANFVEKLSSRFGEDVTFSSCTIPKIGLNEVIPFLEMKGKIQISPDGEIVFAGMPCNH